MCVGRVRPPTLTEKDVQAAKAMLADPDITVEEVAVEDGDVDVVPAFAGGTG